MKFQFDRDAMIKEVAIAQEIIANKSPISILSNVLLSAENNTLTIKASDSMVDYITKIPVEIQDNLVDAIFACHDGVIRFIPAYPSVVETSSNLAIINIGEGKASIKILARSSREDMKGYVVTMLESCFSMAGMKVETAGSYGGWDPNPDSEILHLLLKEYKELFGKDGIIQVDHAGLECSVILGKYPWLDVVSLGPTMKSPHTTTERALIETVAPFWELLKKTLADVPEK
jgi:dipeptidase D